MNENTFDYTQSFIQSIVKLDTLEKMTADLDRELADSQNIMKEIKTLFDSIPQEQEKYRGDGKADLDTFVEATEPKLLLPDMVRSNNAVCDIDEIVTSMKNYTEEIKKNLVEEQAQTCFEERNIQSLDIMNYATNLRELTHRLKDIKIHSTKDLRNLELEEKLNLLCTDVTFLTQMIHTNEKLAESVEQQNQQSTEFPYTYENIIKRLLSNLSDISYLLKNN